MFTRAMTNTRTLVQPTTVERLSRILTEYSVDRSQWTKTVSHLFEEIANGESFLEVDGNGKLIRVVKIANIIITRSDGKTLRESHHLKNGVVKDKKNGNLTEKVSCDETAMEGICRGICEELGEKTGRHVVNIQMIEDEVMNTKPSDSFKCMKCIYKLNQFSGEWAGSNGGDFSTIDKHDRKQIFWKWI